MTIPEPQGSAGNADEEVQGARQLPEESSPLKPSATPAYRGILEIMKERNWEGLPEHIRWSERNSRIRTVSGFPGGSDTCGAE